MMNSIFKIFFLLSLFNSFLFASSFKIYASKDIAIDALSKAQISKLYLKKISRINGVKVIVYDNTKDYKEFTKFFLHKTPSQIHAYWMKQIFLGKKVPPVKLTQKEIIQKLESSSNAIIYSSDKLNGKVLYEKE